MTEPRVPSYEAPAETSLGLLERVKAQDQVAWDRLVRLYSPLVYRWCRQAGVSAEGAADVGQEVFQAVARKIRDFRRDREGDSFRGWLRTITARKVCDHFRDRHGEEAAGGSDALDRMMQVPAPADSAGVSCAEETQLLYRRAVELIQAEFEGPTWRAFWRTAVEGDSPRDVAGDLGVSVNAVYLAKSRVLKRLREEFVELIDL
jgi:RNA polymerase sigma-70 factor (ECF subfamily)